jgi:hypothetical protein
MKNYLHKAIFVIAIILVGFSSGCTVDGKPQPRLAMFVGVDISGSFISTGYFDESLKFLSHYIYAHLHGMGGLEKPKVLFVSSIGGAEPGEPKAFYPIHVFENRSVDEIHQRLQEIFPKDDPNNFTDFNAFFEQIALTIRNQRLVMSPISVVMVSDGIPDVTKNGETNYRSIDLSPVERYSRNITIRLLYTNPVTGKAWETEIPRRRIKIWTQSATVMTTWNDSTIYVPGKPIAKQEQWLDWTVDNVDYGVPARSVD